MATLTVVDQIYDAANELDKEVGKKPEAFQRLLGFSSASDQAKQLCAQIIPKHFKNYPDLQESALDAIVDMCETDNPQVRKAAINAMPELCRQVPMFQVKVCDILTQLLQTEGDEMEQVKKAIHKLIDINLPAAISGLFVQVTSGEVTLREKAMGFVSAELMDKHRAKIIGNPQAEDALQKEVVKALETAVGGEVELLVEMLGQLDKFKGPRRRQLANYVVAPLQGDQAEFAPADEDSRACYKAVVKLARNYSKDGPVPLLATYTYSKVLSSLAQVPSEHLQDVALCAAEVVARGPPEDGLNTLLPKVYKTLMDWLPQAPEEGQDQASINYTTAEALLFIFHTLAAQNKEFLSAEGEGQERAAALRQRLTYLGTRSNSESAIFNQRMAKEKDKEKLKTLELGKRTTSNVVEIVRDLVRNTGPTYKTPKPSWLSTATAQPPKTPQTPQTKPANTPTQQRSGGGKRPAETKSSDQPTKRPVGSVYQPPQGKYSANIGITEKKEKNNGGQKGGQRGGRVGRGVGEADRGVGGVVVGMRVGVGIMTLGGRMKGCALMIK